MESGLPSAFPLLLLFRNRKLPRSFSFTSWQLSHVGSCPVGTPILFHFRPGLSLISSSLLAQVLAQINFLVLLFSLKCISCVSFCSTCSFFPPLSTHIRVISNHTRQNQYWVVLKSSVRDPVGGSFSFKPKISHRRNGPKTIIERKSGWEEGRPLSPEGWCARQ